MFADTHCHLDFFGPSSDLKALMLDLAQSDIQFLIVPATDQCSWSRVAELSVEEPRVYYGIGMHPYFIENHSLENLAVIDGWIFKVIQSDLKKLKAVGEIGLDFTKPFRDKQLEVFEGQLYLAKKFDLPIILHARKAHSEVISLLKKYQICNGVVHAFSGSWEMMKNYIDLGIKIGVGPVITWPSAHKSRRAISMAPLDAIVLETDSPDMAVNGKLKGCGSPMDLFEVFRSLVNLRDEPEMKLQEAIWHNSKTLFNI